MKEPYTIETSCYTIDFTNRKAYEDVLKECERLSVNMDYYFLEFDTTDTEPEAYMWQLTKLHTNPPLGGFFPYNKNVQTNSTHEHKSFKRSVWTVVEPNSCNSLLLLI